MKYGRCLVNEEKKTMPGFLYKKRYQLSAFTFPLNKKMKKNKMKATDGLVYRSCGAIYGQELKTQYLTILFFSPRFNCSQFQGCHLNLSIFWCNISELFTILSYKSIGYRLRGADYDQELQHAVFLAHGKQRKKLIVRWSTKWPLWKLCLVDIENNIWINHNKSYLRNIN